MEEVGPALFVNGADLAGVGDFGAVCCYCGSGFEDGVEERFGVEGRLREETVSWGDAEDTAEGGGEAEEEDIEGETARLAGVVTGDGADYGGDFVVEEEKHGDD